MLQTFLRLVTLRPYGDQLVDGMARTWLVLAAVTIAAIAFCDALAWGYFASTTTTGWAAAVAASVAGLLVFALVWSVDAMFVMQDRANRSLAEVRRDRLAAAARVVLVILTFTFTAPFLTQLVFARDIEASVSRHNDRTIAAGRARIATALASRQRDLEKEIAGKGSSGRYGRGPTAAAIEGELAALRSDLAAFDAGASDPSLLASRYGIDLVREGPATRARVIDELSLTPSFRATQRTIKAFLLFMFLGLVCLKLFQPQSVRIYYSAELQAAYSRLQAGLFDHRLDPREQAKAGGMPPLRFADWYQNDQRVRDLSERLQSQEDAIRMVRETLRLDMEHLQEVLAATTVNADALEQQVVAKRHHLSELQQRIAEEQQALDDFRYDMDEELSLRDQQLLISGRKRTARRLAEHRAAEAAERAALQRLSDRLEATRSDEQRLRASLAAAGGEASGLSEALQKARQRRLAEILQT